MQTQINLFGKRKTKTATRPEIQHGCLHQTGAASGAQEVQVSVAIWVTKDDHVRLGARDLVWCGGDNYQSRLVEIGDVRRGIGCHVSVM